MTNLHATNINDTTFTLDVEIRNETRTVTFQRSPSYARRARAVWSDDYCIAIGKYGASKVWPEVMTAWLNADGSWKIAQDYNRLNRNGYSIRGWFNVVAPTGAERHVSRHGIQFRVNR